MAQMNLNKLFLGTLLASSVLTSSVCAKEIYTNMARMQAMDKITGKVSEIDVPVNGEVKFGSFSITVRACATRPPEETPENYAFVDIIDDYNIKTKVNVFRGWMFSSSPALNAVEHPIYDVWLLKCYDGDLKGKHLLTEEELRLREEISKVSEDADSKLPADFKVPEDDVSVPEEKVSDNKPISLLPEIPDEEKEIATVEMKGLVDDEQPEAKVISLEKAQNDANQETDNSPKMLVKIESNLDDMVKNIEETLSENQVKESALIQSAEQNSNDAISGVSIVRTVEDKAKEQELQEKLEKASEERRQKAIEAIEARSAENENQESEAQVLEEAPAREIGNAPEVKDIEDVSRENSNNIIKDAFSDDDIIIEEIEEDGMIEE